MTGEMLRMNVIDREKYHEKQILRGNNDASSSGSQTDGRMDVDGH